MKIYIASSWKNQHGVEMLTSLLRDKGHEVISWIENNNEESRGMPFEDWIKTEYADLSFSFDTGGATTSDACIYYGPAGKDACAEMGAAWASHVPIIGLWAKGEDIGLMRKMALCWCDNISEVMDVVESVNSLKSSQ